MKWGFIPQGGGKPLYLVVNADESEPGTCKDIPLMMANPHALVEGVVIASYAIRATHAFIYVRGEVVHVLRRLQAAVREAYAAGYLGKDILGSGFDLEIIVHAGAGAYICGEETALLDSLEGRRGQPRLRPPFPAVAGLYASPDRRQQRRVDRQRPADPAQRRRLVRVDGHREVASGSDDLFSLSGHVARPGQYEAPMGITLRELLDLLRRRARGPRAEVLDAGRLVDAAADRRAPRRAAVLRGHRRRPGRCSAPRRCRSSTRPPASCAPSCAGPSSTRTSRAASARPCREGTFWLVQILRRLEQRRRGTEEDLEKLLDICDNILGRSFCALGDGATSPITSVAAVLPRRVPRALEHGGCPFDPAASTLFDAARLQEREQVPDDRHDDTTGAAVPEARRPRRPDHRRLRVRVPKGTLVIRAAELIGIQVPRFCDHPLLDPVGACRQCLVEVEGPAAQAACASCTITVTDGMVVKTQLTSPVADKAQQGVMELLLINHPLDCPVCDKGGECPLQNQAMSNGRGETRFEDVKRTFPKPINISSQVLLDRERCVLCARCTRFSAQVAGDPFIEMLERGALQQVGIYEDQPFQSYFSGNTVQICPVGALTGAAYRFRSRPFDLVSSPGVCEHCASRLRDPHRPPPRQGPAPAGRRRPRGQRGVELRQGPLGLPVRHRAGPPHHPAGPRRGRRAGADLVGRGAATSPPRAAPRRRARPACSSAAGSPSRTPTPTPSSPGSCSAPTTSTSGPARTPPRRRPSSPRTSPAAVWASRTPTSRRRRPCCSSASSPRTSRRSCSCGCARPCAARGSPGLRRRAVRPPRAGEAVRRLLPAAPGTEAAVLDALRREPTLQAAAGDRAAARARCRAARRRGLAAVPGALSAVVRLAEATGARLAWVPRRAGERGALEAGALPGLLPGGRPVADAAARVDVATAWGVDALPDDGRPGHRRRSWPRPRPAEVRALLVGGVDPDDLPDPTAALRRDRRRPFVVSLELRPSAVTERADVVLPGRAGRREGRHLPRLGGPGPAVRRGAARHAVDARRPGAARRWPSAMGVDLGLPDVAAAARARSRDRRLGRRPRAASPVEARRPAAARGAGRGGARHLVAAAGRRPAAGRRAVPRRHRPAGRGPDVSARPPRRSVSPTATRSPSPPTRGASPLPVASPTCPTASSGCRPTRAGVPVRADARRRPGRVRLDRRWRPTSRREVPHDDAGARLARRSPASATTLVAGRRQGARRLRLPRRDDAVLDLVGAPRRRAHAAPRSARTGSARRACCRASPTASSWR